MPGGEKKFLEFSALRAIASRETEMSSLWSAATERVKAFSSRRYAPDMRVKDSRPVHVCEMQFAYFSRQKGNVPLGITVRLAG
jgi:hypothetical protein